RPRRPRGRPRACAPARTTLPPPARVDAQGSPHHRRTPKEVPPMMLNWLSKSALRRLNRAARRGRRPTPRPPLGAQPLEERAVPAVVAHADPGAGHEAAYLTTVGHTLYVVPGDGEIGRAP